MEEVNCCLCRMYIFVCIALFGIITLDLSDCVPTGPCAPNCPCIVDGKYYNAGERWSSPLKPCTTFECLDNGTHWRVQDDCLYKGECKARDTVWADGCTKFKCAASSNQTFYQITETGCSTNISGQSSCLAVGNRATVGCDVIECQINGHLLETATVQYGCLSGGVCHNPGSYWHDGCMIYTCVESAVSAQEQIAANVKMQWPVGNYALLKSSTGCPSNNTVPWQEGSASIKTNRNTYINTQLLAGNYTEGSMRYEFCIHEQSTAALAIYPVYSTFWEPGSYCVLKSGSICPRGFAEGSIHISDSSVGTPVTTGTLPGGVYTTGNTTLEVCCRDDGVPTREITLPFDNSFLLFLKSKDRICQSVKGMVSTQVDITLTNSPTVTGDGPAVYQPAPNQNTITLCHYKQSECGCKDASGQFIALNTEKSIDCMLKKCVEQNGQTIIQLVSGGCAVDGRCQAENSMWTEFVAETCTKRTCKRRVNGNETNFMIEEVTKGCRDGEVCKDVGTEIYRGCYTSSCVLDTPTNPMFKVIRADCPWQDSCMPPNATWDHNCMSYRCDMKMENGQYQWNVIPVKYGCNDGKGNCYDVGQNVTDQCYDAVCRLNENKTIVYMDVIRGGCTWQDQCKPVNAVWNDGCHTFRCEWTTAEMGFTATVNATSVSCSWNNTCYEHNATWSDGCVTYMCEVNRAAEEVNWSVKTVGLACKDFNGNCVAVGDSVVENCVTYTCNKMGDRLRLEPVTVGCQWNNTCTPEDSIWTDTSRCVDYKCQKSTGPTGTVMQVSVVSYGCVFNNTCKDVNATWQDGCRTRKCVVKQTDTTIQRSISPISAGCDDQGICRKLGYKKVTDTCREYECVFNETYKDAFFTLARGACRSRNGECKMVGTQWTEIQNELCLNYECQKSSLGYVSKMLERKCIDAEGKCQPVGATGFSADINGILKTNCACEETGETISVKCRAPTVHTK